MARKATGKSGARSGLKPLAKLSKSYAARIRTAAARAGVPVKEFRRQPSMAAERKKAQGKAAPPPPPIAALGADSPTKRPVGRTAIIYDYVLRQAAKFPGTDVVRLAEKNAALIQAKVAAHGWQWFTKLRRMNQRNAARSLQQPKGIKGRPEPLGINMDDLSDEWGLDPEMFGYH